MDEEQDLWLPELIYPDVPGQIDDAYLDRLYAVFERDFVLSKPEWPDLRFSVTMRPNHMGWPSTFWHIISEGPDEESRRLNIDRCARIAWPLKLIKEFILVYPENTSSRIRWWETSRGKDRRLLISTADHAYVVVVALRRTHAHLITAYPAYPHTVNHFSHQWRNYIAKNG